MADRSSSSTTMATLAKLTSLSTQTLSLLLERQRLQTISAGPNATSLHLPQITRNLNQLRTGILDLETKDGRTEAVKLLRSQYERMRVMLGPDGENLQKYVCSFRRTHRFLASFTKWLTMHALVCRIAHQCRDQKAQLHLHRL